MRVIEFTELNAKISLDLRQKPEIELNLIKYGKSLYGLTQFYSNLNIAYKGFLTIKPEKYDDIKKTFKLY